MSTSKQLLIQIIPGRNSKPVNVIDEEEVKYYKDEGGKPKCIKFTLNKKEDFRIIQLCEDVETVLSNNNKLFNITRNSSKVQIKFKKVSKNINGAKWCVEVFSLINRSLNKKSAWIEVLSKRKIPAKNRLNPHEIIKYKKRKRKADKDSNFNSCNKRIKELTEENIRLKQEIYQLKLTNEFSDIPFYTEFNDIDLF